MVTAFCIVSAVIAALVYAVCRVGSIWSREEEGGHE